MKRLLTVMILGLFVFVGCTDSREKLSVFNVGDYMDRSVIRDFENE